MIGDSVARLGGLQQDAKDRDGNDAAWCLLPGESATVVEVDADGDIRLCNPRGLESAFVFRKFFVNVAYATQANPPSPGKPPGNFDCKADTTERNDGEASSLESGNGAKEFVFNSEAVEFVPQFQGSQRAALNAKAAVFTPKANLTAAEQFKIHVEAAAGLINSGSIGHEAEAMPFSASQPESVSPQSRARQAEVLPPLCGQSSPAASDAMEIEEDVAGTNLASSIETSIEDAWHISSTSSHIRLHSRQLPSCGRARLFMDNSDEDEFENDGCMRGYGTDDEEADDTQPASSAESPLRLAIRAQGASLFRLRPSSWIILPPRGSLLKMLRTSGSIQLFIFFLLLVSLSRRAAVGLARIRRRH
jgi:hypothetical protein